MVHEGLLSSSMSVSSSPPGSPCLYSTLDESLLSELMVGEPETSIPLATMDTSGSCTLLASPSYRYEAGTAPSFSDTSLPTIPPARRRLPFTDLETISPR